MTAAGNQRTAQANRPGKHRRSATADTWTPAVDPAGSSGRHRATEPEPVAAPPEAGLVRISGELPLPRVAEPITRPTPKLEPPTQPTPQLKPQQTPAKPPVRREPARLPVALTKPSQPVQRTKVTLAPAVQQTEDVRVYLAPPLEGLDAFDLGSIPASVTPPRSWRKAAWFATVSSGGVAVALLLAGSYMVGQPVDPPVAQDGWVGLNAKPPVVHDDGFAADDPSQRRSDARSSSSVPQRIADVVGVQPSESNGRTPSNGPSSPPVSGVPSTTPGGPTTPAEPQKPPPTPAPRETRSDAVYKFPPNAETMGNRSEIFFNEITENPERAHEQTGGELYAEGADGIAQRYADIAYFEVQHIYIDQKNRETVNTVKVFYTDGTETTEQRTLQFEEGDRITRD